MGRRGRGRGRISEPTRSPQLGFPGLDEFLAQVKPSRSDEIDWERFDADDILDRLVSANLDSSVIVVDEIADLPKPKNIVEWVRDPRFLQQDPYPKQIEILLALREDYCPRCSDRPYVQNIPTDAKIGDILDRTTLLEFGVCPKCKGTRRDFQAAKLFSNPNELILVTGQRAGKTTVVAYDWSFALQKFVTLPDPARMYRVIKGQYLQSFFCAITAKQAYETLWVQAMAVYDSSPWFENLANLLVAKGRELGRQLYQKGKTFLAYWHKNLACTFGPAEGASQRGRTRFYCAVDEWGWFARGATEGRKKIKGNEDDIYTALTRSLLTVRSGCDRLREGDYIDAPNGVMANIGSPYSVQDKGFRLLREKSSYARAICRHYSTFDINPTIRPEDIDPLELESPDGQRDYYAIPPMATDPFIEDRLIVETAIDLNRPSQLVYVQEPYVESPDGHPDILRRYVFGRITDFPKDRFAARVLALDAGEKHASFAMLLAHVDKEHRTVVDGVIEIQPQLGMPVHFPSVFEHCIEKLIDWLNIRYLVSDRWQSTDIIQRARIKGVVADRYSLRIADFRDFKGRLYSGRVRFPTPEVNPIKMAEGDPRSCLAFPNAHLLVQTLTVRKVGEKVIKPQNGFDDLFRCLVLADWMAEKHRAEMASSVDEYGLPVRRSVGVVAGFSESPGALAGPQMPRPDGPRRAIGVVGRATDRTPRGGW